MISNARIDRWYYELEGGAMEEPKKKGEQNKRVYTVTEVMDMLDVCKCTAYRLMKSGKFRVIKVGSSIRVSKESFDKWLNEQEGGLEG